MDVKYLAFLAAALIAGALILRNPAGSVSIVDSVSTVVDGFANTVLRYQTPPAGGSATANRGVVTA